MPNDSGDGHTQPAKHGKISLSVPWDGVNPSLRPRSQLAITDSEEVQRLFIRERTALHMEVIRQENKTKRLGLTIAAVLVISATAIVTFAPEGRQVFSYWLGAALVIAAAGCVGYKRVWGKTKIIDVGAESGPDPE